MFVAHPWGAFDGSGHPQEGVLVHGYDYSSAGGGLVDPQRSLHAPASRCQDPRCPDEGDAPGDRETLGRLWNGQASLLPLEGQRLGSLVGRGESMASIKKRNGSHRVRWRDPDGRARSRQCPDRSTAEKLRKDIERCVAEGRRWEPRDVREVPDLGEILKAFLRDYARRNSTNSAMLMARSFDVFLRWLKAREARQHGALRPDLLSKALLTEWYDDLVKGGRHGHARKLSTRKRMVQRLEAAWAWAAEEDEYAEYVPRPRKLDMPSGATDPTVAPTWEEMDQCVGAAHGAVRQLAIVLRFTGLRVQQAMRLRWSDVDMDRGTLTIRGELGKTKQERRGRGIPLSPHLLKELAGWGRREGWLVPSFRTGKSERIARQRDMQRAWIRAGVREAVWRGDSHHSFRNGFVSGLKKLRADDEAVEYLVGHSLGLRGAYTDPEALPLQEAVNLIPPLGRPDEVPLLDRIRGQEEGVREREMCPQRVPLEVVGW